MLSAGASGGSSLKSSKTARFAWFLMKARPSALANWVKDARAQRTQGKSGLMKEEREELVRLRREVRELRMEREVLKKAAAFFAKEPR